MVVLIRVWIDAGLFQILELFTPTHQEYIQLLVLRCVVSGGSIVLIFGVSHRRSLCSVALVAISDYGIRFCAG